MASAPAKIVAAREVTVNMTSVGDYRLIDQTSVTTKLWVTRRIGYRTITSSGVTVLGKVTLGGNSPDYDNVYSTGGGFSPDPSTPGIVWITFNQPGYIDLGTNGLIARVDSAATGTFHSVRIIVVGYYN